MKLIVKDLISGQEMVVEFPAPKTGASSLVLSLRTEDESTEGADLSLSYREVYVARKGGMTVRTH